ncbi:phosphate/phosphite/phosphonate ABC transporter substrate-binding protein [Roseibium sp.]|uniref:phosphate/phosphite/phosphonate ABC transporter substrate-binding protein n=1 Tax=Roseibium sp. TaxID=1936156 RepID=UPI003BA9DE7B
MSRRSYHPVRLPMYDWPEVRASTKRLETALQDAIAGALGLPPSDCVPWPEDRGLEVDWLQPGLLLSQTCGYPLTHALSGSVRPVGVPHYAADGCDGGRYCSHLVVDRDSGYQTLADLQDSRAVYNGPDSQSGMNVFRHEVSRIAGGAPFFSSVRESGGHLASLHAVAEGTADIASVDAVCWALACQELPGLVSRLRSIGRTGSVPCLPLVTSLRFTEAEAEQIAIVVQAVFADAAIAEDRERLLINGFSRVSEADYAPILEMERNAARRGYPELA